MTADLTFDISAIETDTILSTVGSSVVLIGFTGGSKAEPSYLKRIETTAEVVSLDAWTYTIWETAIPSIEISFNAYDDVTYVGEYWVRFEVPSGGITFTAPSTVVFPLEFEEFEEGKIYELGFVDGNVTLNYWDA